MIPKFALQLICGLATMWTVVPKQDITSGFFRIQNLLTLGLAVLAAVTANQFRGELNNTPDLLQMCEFGIAILLAFLSFLGSVFWTLERRIVGSRLGAFITFIACGGIVLPVFSQSRPAVPVMLQLADTISAAWLLGAVTATMLLGHWYLTATGMALRPFIQYTKVLLGAVVTRIVVVATAAALIPQTVGASWTLQILHWAGLAGPLILGVLTLRILKYRNTQSATGVMYAATILVFMGEMACSLMSATQTNGSGI